MLGSQIVNVVNKFKCLGLAVQENGGISKDVTIMAKMLLKKICLI